MNALRSFFLFLLFLSLTSANAMNEEEVLFGDKTKIWLVHVAGPMSSDNTKVAGSQIRTCIDSVPRIEPMGTNLRTRITLHHCLGGVTPSSNRQIHFMGIPIKASHLDKNSTKDLCAYVDHLGSFNGEVYGGLPEDFMTIDRHYYGPSSIIIVPEHRYDEFRNNNPSYEGTLIKFEPAKISLRKKVKEVISDKKGLPFTTIDDVKHFTHYSSFCEQNKYSYTPHCLTNFSLFEEMVTQFRQTIYDINNRQDKPSLLPANQVKPMCSLIQVLLTEIYQSVGPRLSQEKNDALRNWVSEIKEWLTLFEVDAELRLDRKKSLFLNNSQIKEFIKNRSNKNYLYTHGESLLEQNLAVLNTEGEFLFAEEALREIFTTRSPLVFQFQNALKRDGYPVHAAGLMLSDFAWKVGLNMGTGRTFWSSEDEELFFKTCNDLVPSPQLQNHLRAELHTLLNKDESFQNQIVISWLNSRPGKILRKSIWGNDSSLNFWQILRISPPARLLLEGVEPRGSSWSPEVKRFVERLRPWILSKCAFCEGFNFESQACVPVSGKNPHEEKHFSLFNYRWVTNTASIIHDYITELLKDITDPKNELRILIQEGCFASWRDLFDHMYCLDDQITREDVKKACEASRFYLLPRATLTFGPALKKVIQQRQEDLETFNKCIPIYEKIAHKIQTAGEDIDRGNLDWYIDVLLEQCVKGVTSEFGDNRIIIDPNRERAEILYKKLMEVRELSEEQKERLEEKFRKLRGSSTFKEN